MYKSKDEIIKFAKTDGGKDSDFLNYKAFNLPLTSHVAYERMLKGSYDDVEKVLEKYLVNDDNTINFTQSAGTSGLSALTPITDGDILTINKPEEYNQENWPFDKPHYFLMNIAVGGNLGGLDGVDDSIFPATMEIDYVRLYALD